ncbi:aspartate phosphatase, partial [Bacillus atrophaeus]|nr:aspartate phosphatase [Bacillus atrophaeus]
ARQLNDEILLSEFRFLKTLFTEDSVKELEDILRYLEDKEMLPDMEDLATDAAKYYKENEDHKVANVFYEKVLYAQKQIQRGDCLYEY